MSAQPIACAQKTRKLLQELQISPNKSLGQNFLISANIAEKIAEAANIQEGDKVLEIGAGLGALSENLVSRAGALSLLEVDARLCKHLSRLFADNEGVEVIQADALRFNYAEHAAAGMWRDYLIIANLPYNITTPLLQYLLLKGGHWRSLTLMMQYEVAHKLLPAANGASSGPLALLAQYYGKISLLFTASRECFLPAPQVQSAVIQIVRHTQPPFAVMDTECFARFLNAAFSHRRKTLENSLNNALGGGVKWWRQTLRLSGVEEHKRPQQLALPDYVALFSLLRLQEFLI